MGNGRRDRELGGGGGGRKGGEGRRTGEEGRAVESRSGGPWETPFDRLTFSGSRRPRGRRRELGGERRSLA